MDYDNDDFVSDEERACGDLFEALSQGDAREAARNLRKLKALDQIELQILADLLDGTASVRIYPWKIVIQRRSRGRPPADHLTDEAPKSSGCEALWQAIDRRDHQGAASVLRNLQSIGSTELSRMAALFDGNAEECNPSLQNKLTLKQRRRGKPVCPLQSEAVAFVLSLMVDAVSDAGREAAIVEVAQRIKRSRATVQRARKRARRSNSARPQ